MRLINTATGEAFNVGCMLHVVTGPSLGQAWRYEHLRPHEDGHRVHVTRSHPKMGRVHREFHPMIFGCRVEVEITFTRRLCQDSRHFVGKVDEWFLAGVFALVPLAFFEHYDLATKIPELLGAGGPTGH